MLSRTELARSLVSALLLHTSALACGDSVATPSDPDETGGDISSGDGTSYDITYGDSSSGDSSSGDPPDPQAFSADSISGSWSHTCARNDAGELFCWGPRFSDPLLDESIATPAAFGNDRWRAHSSGESHACAVRDDGTLWCWGHNCAGQLGDGTRDHSNTPVRVGDATHWIDVAAGGGHSCAIDDSGALSCWGGHDYGQSSGCEEMQSLPPTAIDGTWLDVSAHYYSIHALRSDGTLWRMLDAPYGEAPVFQPATQIGSSTWRAIATGVGHVCGIRTDGTLACASSEDLEETQVGTDTDWGDAIAVSYHGCATKTDGSLWCWGDDDTGRPAPTRVGDEVGWVAVSTGYGHTCGARDGIILCWGGNGRGELGAGDLPLRTEPTRVGDSTAWSSPTLGYGLSCARDDEAWTCSGPNGFAALEASWTALQVVDSSVCAIDDALHLWCWGNGDPDPVQLHPDTTFLPDGLSERCALDEERRAWCYPGKFNNSSSLNTSTQTWSRIASGSSGHRCGITTEGALLCWGENGSGQLGTGFVGGDESTPVEVAGGGTWRSVSVANEAGSVVGISCGTRDDGPTGGGLYCWGSGEHFGTDVGVAVQSPAQVGDAQDWMSVSISWTRGCAIDSAGELWCWGSNMDGGLGIGSTDLDFHAPERIGPEQTWSEVDVDSGHTCATTTEGTLWCWGYGGAGELGNGLLGSAEPIPTAMPSP